MGFFKQTESGTRLSNGNAAGRLHNSLELTYRTVTLKRFPTITFPNISDETKRILTLHPEAEGMHVFIIPGRQAFDQEKNNDELNSFFLDTWNDVESSFLIPKNNC